MMIWTIKQLISTGFCIQIIKGQKCPKPAIVAGGLFQTRVLPLYHDCTVQSYFTRFWSSNVRDYPLAVEWCHEINEFADDYVEIIYAKSENGCGELFGWGMKVYVQNQSGPSNGILHRFCLTGGSTLTSQDYNPSSVVYVSKPTRVIWRYLLSKFRALLCCSLSQLLFCCSMKTILLKLL